MLGKVLGLLLCSAAAKGNVVGEKTIVNAPTRQTTYRPADEVEIGDMITCFTMYIDDDVKGWCTVDTITQYRGVAYHLYTRNNSARFGPETLIFTGSQWKKAKDFIVGDHIGRDTDSADIITCAKKVNNANLIGFTTTPASVLIVAGFLTKSI